MSKKFKCTQTYVAIMLATIIGVQVANSTIVLATPEAVVEKKVSEEQKLIQNNSRYLEVYFQISNLPEEITYETFVEAVEKVSGQQLDTFIKTGNITYLDAVKLAVIGANFEELALTYSQEKIEAKGIDAKTTTSYGGYIACALDTGLIEKSDLSVYETKKLISKEDTIELLMAVADANGKTRNYLGYTNEDEIYGKVLNAFESAILFENDKLQTIGSKAVMNGVTTGYNLLNSNYSANFIPELTLRYGHSTMKHATQLIGLLNSEGIVAKVQVEPKTSIFRYLPEWGPVPEATPDYRVEVINDELMLANSLEYDLVFEFETEEDKLAFDTIVETYAKKNDDNQGEGLLFASWWQPLYISSIEIEDGYQTIYNNVITDGSYTLNPFCLPEDKEKVFEGLTAIDATIEVKQVPMWCNDAFYRYLSGASHQ